MNDFIGTRVLVYNFHVGLFYGTLDSVVNNCIKLKDSYMLRSYCMLLKEALVNNNQTYLKDVASSAIPSGVTFILETAVVYTLDKATAEVFDALLVTTKKTPTVSVT